jgi:uncharacterized NAD(P)/FAD-binding protein YdhS
MITVQKANFTYRFRKNVVQSILTDKEPEKSEPIIDNLSLLRHLRNIVKEYTDKEIDFDEVEEQINEALQENKKSILQKNWIAFMFILN